MSNRRADELKPGDKIARGALKGGTVVWATPHNRVFVDAGRAGSMTVTPDFEFAIEDPVIYEAGDMVVRKSGGAEGAKAVLVRQSEVTGSWDVVVTEARDLARKGQSRWNENYFEHVPASKLELRVGARVRRTTDGLSGTGGKRNLYGAGLEGTVTAIHRGGDGASVQLIHRFDPVSWDRCNFEVIG